MEVVLAGKSDYNSSPKPYLCINTNLNQGDYNCLPFTGVKSLMEDLVWCWTAQRRQQSVPV